MEYYGGIEAGGTKFNCVIASGPENILAQERVATDTPDNTISKVINFFVDTCNELKINLTSLGVGSFGPINLDKNSSRYGFITSTPKLGWQNTNIVGALKDELHIPIAFDTDVNAAALGERKWGAGIGVENFLYFTIGTGIGGGAIINGHPLHGLIHPEMGHILLNRDKVHDHFEGNCPFHKNCFEGLASGPAINERWGMPAYQLPPSHQAWIIEADYIAQAMSTFICAFSPERIILGGGVMQQQHLFPMIRSKTLEYLNGYVQASQILENSENYIVPPELGNRAGVLGAIAMAQEILKTRNN